MAGKKKERTSQGGVEGGLGGILKGLGDLVEKLGELAESGRELSKTGEIHGSGKELKGIYGFTVKVGLGDEGPSLEPFGNIRRDIKSGRWPDPSHRLRASPRPRSAPDSTSRRHRETYRARIPWRFRPRSGSRSLVAPPLARHSVEPGRERCRRLRREAARASGRIGAQAGQPHAWRGRDLERMADIPALEATRRDLKMKLQAETMPLP